MTHEANPSNNADAGRGLSEGLGAGSEAQFCPECDDGDGNCAFPYYGVAPHTHALPTPTHPTDWLGSTRPLPREQWPANFRPDDDSDDCGTYTHCLACGAPNAQANLTDTAR